ncbi:MAG: AAA family ATPase [bacterium]
MRTIAIINQKGGCGKTTSTINIGACLAHKKTKVLIVDMDPQAHATLGLGYKPGEYSGSIHDLLVNKDQSHETIEDVLLRISPYLHLIPSDIVLSTAEPILLQRDNREYYLADILKSISDQYDIAIIDCPPNIGILTFNSLLASNEVIIPIESGLFSLHGLARLMETINLVNLNCGHKIKVNALATMYDRRTKIAEETLFETKRCFLGHVFKTVINQNVKLKEAASYGKPIISYCQKCSGFKDYMDLSKEILELEEVKFPMEDDRRKEIKPPVITREGVLFTCYAPQAKSVRLVANFNEWNQEQMPLFNIEGDGIWQKIVPLKEGKYQYKFVIDGEWMKDPINPNIVSSPFGENSIFEVQ